MDTEKQDSLAKDLWTQKSFQSQTDMLKDTNEEWLIDSKFKQKWKGYTEIMTVKMSTFKDIPHLKNS